MKINPEIISPQSLLLKPFGVFCKSPTQSVYISNVAHRFAFIISYLLFTNEWPQLEVHLIQSITKFNLETFRELLEVN